MSSFILVSPTWFSCPTNPAGKHFKLEDQRWEETQDNIHHQLRAAARDSCSVTQYTEAEQRHCGGAVQTGGRFRRLHSVDYFSVALFSLSPSPSNPRPAPAASDDKKRLSPRKPENVDEGPHSRAPPAVFTRKDSTEDPTAEEEGGKREGGHAHQDDKTL